MTLDQACADLNAIALRFAEFAIRDEESAQEWSALSLTGPQSTRHICVENASKYQRRAENRDREAKAILTVLLKLSEYEGESHGRRCGDVTEGETGRVAAG